MSIKCIVFIIVLLSGIQSFCGDSTPMADAPEQQEQTINAQEEPLKEEQQQEQVEEKKSKKQIVLKKLRTALDISKLVYSPLLVVSVMVIESSQSLKNDLDAVIA